MKKKTGYWEWWYQRNKNDLRSIGYFILVMLMLGFVALVIYAVVKVNEFIGHAMETIKQSPETSFNPLPILVLIFLSCIILICFVSYRKYRKENSMEDRKTL